MKDPRELSGRYAQEAVRTVHAQEDVPADAPLDAHPDPKVPGANYVDVSTDTRYWVGMAGEVVPTSTEPLTLRRNPRFSAAHGRYAAAVDSVRLRYRTPVTEELFAVPDTHIPEAFFVYDTEAAQTVRWVDPVGEVYDGYRLIDDEPTWDERTATARRTALSAQLSPSN